MERLTSNKAVEEMSMVELAHNSCYAENRKAMYRDFETVRDARDFARELYEAYVNERLPADDDEFDGRMIDDLQYEPTIHANGLIALFYRNLWAMADLRERLKQYEDAEEQGLLLRLPCKVGMSIWVNGILGCGEAEEYKVIRVDYHSTLGTKRNEFYIEALLASNPTGGSIGFYNKEIEKTVFLTKEEAEQALKHTENAR